MLDYTRMVITGKEIMFAVDVPYIPDLDSPMVISQTQDIARAEFDYILNECQPVDHVPTEPVYYPVRSSFGPSGLLKIYYQSIGRSISTEDLSSTLLSAPKHGELIDTASNGKASAYEYAPNSGFVGDDQATFLVEYDDIRFKIVVLLRVGHNYSEAEEGTVCPLVPTMLKAPKTGSILESINITFANLDDGALGPDNALGITLDTTANNYGWYMDLIPGQNEEYLPTSNPYEWIAKPG